MTTTMTQTELTGGRGAVHKYDPTDEMSSQWSAVTTDHQERIQGQIQGAIETLWKEVAGIRPGDISNLVFVSMRGLSKTVRRSPLTALLLTGFVGLLIGRSIAKNRGVLSMKESINWPK